MALNGTISGGNYNNIYSYYLTWSASQNIENNNSTITLNWIYKKMLMIPMADTIKLDHQI